MSGVDVLAVMDSASIELQADSITKSLELLDARDAVTELLEKVEQIERLARTADPELVDVPGMLGDIARAALARCKGGAK